jgi:hypothetical protein
MYLVYPPMRVAEAVSKPFVTSLGPRSALCRRASERRIARVQSTIESALNNKPRRLVQVLAGHVACFVAEWLRPSP